jgi:uncharacterized SAM-binding protein YcdF (DUF218 family)
LNQRSGRWAKTIPGLLPIGLILIGLGAPAATYLSVPSCNTARTHFDTLVVLGYPTNGDGSASPEERARVLGAVAEYKSGRAAHIIMTGGAAHNRFVEAEAMKRVAVEAGVPADAILVEDKAHDTIENICLSERLMDEHGWQTLEVVSDPAHVVRAALILERFPLPWSTYAAAWPPQYTTRDIVLHRVLEVLRVNWIRWFGFPDTPCLPPIEP